MSEPVPPVKIPLVARTRVRRSAVPVAVGLALLGTGVFAKLVTAREARADAATMLPPLQFAASSAPPTAGVIPVTPVVAAPVMTTTAVPVPAAPVAPSAAPYRMVASGSTGVTVPSDSGRARVASPALIIDLAQTRNEGGQAAGLGQAAQQTADAPQAGGTTGGAFPTASIGDPTGDAIAAAGIGAAAVAGGRSAAGAGLPGNEGFAARVGGQAVEVAVAERLTNLDTLVPQGAIIGAVMETALNSDVPGFARAIVTRDVLSFDGSQVLIPAGSRVIGQYNSGVAQGASRIFIVWSRLIRSDGVSIALASPATDDLGRGGLAGKVNRHFLQRFGGSILLSVLTGGIQAAAASVARGNTVVVNSASEATSLAGQAGRGADIPPTIKTRQGATVRIFVARDLDFSAVGPARK